MAQDRAAGRLTTSEHQAYLNDLRRRLLADEAEVGSALGPQIWLCNSEVSVARRARSTFRRLGRILTTVALVFVAVVLPVMVFFLFQFWLPFKNSSQVHGLVLTFAFAITVWFFVALPRIGWHFGRRQPGGRAALHLAAWALLTYIVMSGAVGRLMSA